MTKEELQKWIAESKLVDSHSEFDANGNYEEWRVYQRDGELFRLEFQNGHPYEKWGEEGFIRGVYEVRKVIRETKTVEVVTYREPDERPARNDNQRST
jgi:hypothetical protein